MTIVSRHSPEKLKKDLPEITRQHEKNMKDILLWDCFGGIIIINGQEYQVSPF